MSDFSLWFITGLQHITDLSGYDHILFVTLVTISVPLKEYKKLLILITGFTIGHSISLALSVTNVIKVQQMYTEMLIAFTILLTAIYHVIKFKKNEERTPRLLYILIPLFGGIHGMGFSYLLRSMLGHEQDLTLPLLYFNIGLEAGQLLIVAAVMLFSLFLTAYLKCPYKYFKLVISCFISIITFKMFAERLLLLF